MEKYRQSAVRNGSLVGGCICACVIMLNCLQNSPGSKDFRKTESRDNRSCLVRGEAFLTHPSHTDSDTWTCSCVLVLCFNDLTIFFLTGKPWKDRSASSIPIAAPRIYPCILSFIPPESVLKCKSDFSGLKSKTHGISHLENVLWEQIWWVLTFET